jgi:hypothetical protein
MKQEKEEEASEWEYVQQASSFSPQYSALLSY